MNNRIIHLALVLIIAIAALFALNHSEQDVAASQGEAMLPTLSDMAGDIDAIRIASAADAVMTFTRTDGQWRTDQGYPADEAKLASLVNQLLAAKKKEAKTQRSDRHVTLGVAALTEQDSQAVRVTLSQASQLQSVLIGRLATAGTGTYMRLPDVDQVWLVDQNVSVSLDPVSWLRQPILDFDSSRIVRVNREGQWQIVRDQSGVFALVNEPERPLRYDGILDTLIEDLTSLTFTQLVTDSSEFESSIEPAMTLTLELLSGAQVTVRGYVTDDRYLVRMEQADPLLAPYWHDRWYAVSNFTFNQINKLRDDLLASLPEPVEAIIQDEGEAPGE